MSHLPKLVPLIMLTAACGGEEIGSSTLEAAWTFESGDCASHGVETVRVTWTLQGSTPQEAEFACTDGQGVLGELAEGGGTYAIAAQGLDAGGVARVENFSQSVTFGQGRTVGPVEITLRPKPANIVVTWGGCPPGVIIPYFIAVYRPPAQVGGELTDKVTEVQETCSSGTATLERVAPGDYVVELDTRAITPMVYATQQVTVVAGEDAQVAFTF